MDLPRLLFGVSFRFFIVTATRLQSVAGESSCIPLSKRLCITENLKTSLREPDQQEGSVPVPTAGNLGESRESTLHDWCLSYGLAHTNPPREIPSP